MFISKMKNDLKYFQLLECRVVKSDTIFQSVPVVREDLCPVDEEDCVNMAQELAILKEVGAITTSSTDENSTMANKRDESTCKACGLSFAQRNKSGLAAAHILNVEEVDEARDRGGEKEVDKLLSSVGLFGVSQLNNLISLCKPRHHYFDQNKICINYDKDEEMYFWEVKDVCLDDDMPEEQGKYRRIKGKKFKLSGGCSPSMLLIEHGLKIFREGTGNKRKRKLVAVSFLECCIFRH